MLSTTAEYALRIMVVLTEAKGSPTTSDHIAARTGVPPDYSVKVLQMLARGQLVQAQRGRGGGFRITCDPGRTSLLDIINAIDPIDRIRQCPIDHTRRAEEFCRLHRRLDEIAALLQESLQRTTLTSLVEGGGPSLCPTVIVDVLPAASAGYDAAGHRTVEGSSAP